MKAIRVFPVFLMVFLVVPFFIIDAVKADSVFTFSKDGLDATVNMGSGLLSMYKWNREAWLTVKYGSNPTSSLSSSSGVSLTYSDFKIDMEIAAIEGSPTIEYAIIIDSKPLIIPDRFTFLVDMANLDFYYQPPLDQELDVKDYDFVNATHSMRKGEVIEYRPLNVVGSYAAYHSSKRDNKYETGKAFQIYRPLLIDAKNNSAWANMTIKKGTLTISLPQDFLKSANYPVIVDPSFGLATVGATNVQSSSDEIRGTWATGAAGYAQSISVYIGNTQGSQPRQAALYLRSDDSKVANTPEIATSNDSAWNKYPFSASVTLSAIDYWICIWGESVDYWYDSGATGKSFYQSLAYPGTWPATLSRTAQSRTYSIFCNYTTTITQNFYGSITTTFTVAGSKTMSYERYGSITETFTISSLCSKLQSLHFYGSITEAFTIAQVRAWLLSKFGSITETFTVSNKRSILETIGGFITETFTVSSAQQGFLVFLNIFGSIAMHFQIGFNDFNAFMAPVTGHFWFIVAAFSFIMLVVGFSIVFTRKKEETTSG